MIYQNDNRELILQDKILERTTFPAEFRLIDANYGFDSSLCNRNIAHINRVAGKSRELTVVWWHEYLEDSVKSLYKNIQIKFDYLHQDRFHFQPFKDYVKHPAVEFKNFICSFNGFGHVGRQLLTSILNNQGYFNPEYSSKNFVTGIEQVPSQLDNLDLTSDEIVLYRRFFDNPVKFNETVYSLSHTHHAQHDKNIYNVEDKLTQSFLHIVSETTSTSYYPYVSEKFLYSIVTRGLFVVNAQPNWHSYVQQYYGFKLYDKIFDYSFDKIQNPVKRLVRLVEMVSKFSTLSTDDWRDLYQLERDTIEFNYDHYFSGNYLKQLAQLE
jgi:hypothetical protein